MASDSSRNMRLAKGTALLVLLLLSGCASPSDKQAENSGPIVITDPTDFSSANLTGAHLHDYWGGASELLLLDEPPANAFTAAAPLGFSFSFQPKDGSIVPQGAAWAVVKVLGADGAGANYDRKELWLRTAQQDAPEKVANVNYGDELNISLIYEDADLPHQTLSGWSFEIRFIVSAPNVGFYAGSIGLRATMIRGLELQEFPAHRDLWQGFTEMDLFSENGELNQGRSGGAYSGNSNIALQPDAGILVPYDAARVLIKLTTNARAGDLQLSYHGADTRTMSVLQPVSTASNVRSYEILVAPHNGDGPYGTQSLWRFSLTSAPVNGAVGAFSGTFSIQAIVQKY